MNTTNKITPIVFLKINKMDCPTDLVLLNTLFLFRLSYHTIGVNSITLADVLCECLQVD